MTPPKRRPLAWLIPRADEPGRVLARRVSVRMVIALIGANLIGALIVVALAMLAFPLPGVDGDTTAEAVNLGVAGLYLLVISPIGAWWGIRRVREARYWLEEDREPTPHERKIVLRAPRRIVTVHVVLWGFAAILFAAIDATVGGQEAAVRIGGLIVFGGLVVCSFVYLIAERLMRPAAARALAAGIGDRRLAPGVKTRILIPWAMGSAVPVLGLMTIGISTLLEGDFKRDELARLVIIIGGTAVLVGALALFFAARAIADPVVGLRKAVRQVEEGDLDVEVPVYDGSEIGQLQAGFNAMVGGLRERERIQDLFGRHVGEEVAEAALEQEIELGGETRDVAVLFTDIVGSTTLAEERPPEEVVELLNHFFAIVVEVVNSHGGHVNKFIGDAALAAFGAPVALDDPASSALAAARELAERLPREVAELRAGIGVSAGEAVAGNVGEESRFEYTVIGEPVNEAARLTELAKQRDGRLLASARIVEQAAEEEAERWQLDASVTLRGHTHETRLAVPT